jgi:hypothetical protein
MGTAITHITRIRITDMGTIRATATGTIHICAVTGDAMHDANGGGGTTEPLAIFF